MTDSLRPHRRFVGTRAWLLVLVAIAALSSIQFERAGVASQIAFEAEDPTQALHDPFRILADPMASGQRLLSPARPEDIEETASIDYDFEIVSEGTYRIWARALWPNACGNSAFVSILQDVRPVFSSPIGQDSYFGRWHWVTAEQGVRLRPGRYVFRVGVSEWDVGLDRFILATSADFHPDAPATPASGLPHVDLDSEWVPQRNTRLERRDGLWISGPANTEVRGPRGMLGRSFHLTAQLQGGDPAPQSLRLFFDQQPDGSHYALEIGAGRCRLLSEGPGGTAVLHDAPAKVSWTDRAVHDVVLQRGYGQILAQLDSQMVLQSNAPPEHPGTVGIGGSAGAFHVARFSCKPQEAIDFATNFDFDFAPLAAASGFNPVSGTWERTEWREFPAAYLARGSGTLVSLAGETAWSDYLVTTALAIAAGSTGGLILRQSAGGDRAEVSVQPGVAGSPGWLRVVEVRGPDRRVLAERRVAVTPDAWYVLDADLRSAELRVWLDGVLVARTQVEVQAGRPGLVATGRDVPSRSALHPMHFLDGAVPREVHIPLKVSPAATEMGVFFGATPAVYNLIRVNYADPRRAQLEAVQFRHGAARTLARSEFDLNAFTDGRALWQPPPELEVAFLLLIDSTQTQALVVSRNGQKLPLPPLPIDCDPHAVVGVYDPAPAPVAIFDDFAVTGLPYEIGRRQGDVQTYGFNTNFTGARDLAAWRFVSGTWTLAPMSNSNLLSSECLAGVTGRGAAVAELKSPLSTPDIDLQVRVYLPRQSRAQAAIEWSGAGSPPLRLWIGREASGRIESVLRSGSQVLCRGPSLDDKGWYGLSMRGRTEALEVSIDGKSLPLNRTAHMTGPFTIRLVVEGSEGARAHFDDVSIRRVHTPLLGAQ